MDPEMKQHDHDHEHGHEHGHDHGHHCKWQKSWKSPVALGIFLPGAALAGAIVLYTLLNISVTLVGVFHTSDDARFMQQLPSQSQGMMQQGAGAVNQ